uniref:Uncharacterized protein n=1 Tax=Mycena chlorophos TaxID=658473 RepID=A0ABQ0L0N1_MYCCL|nr:predicted protein [Mycena chlorophos]
MQLSTLNSVFDGLPPDRQTRHFDPEALIGSGLTFSASVGLRFKGVGQAQQLQFSLQQPRPKSTGVNLSCSFPPPTHLSASSSTFRKVNQHVVVCVGAPGMGFGLGDRGAPSLLVFHLHPSPTSSPFRIRTLARRSGLLQKSNVMWLLEGFRLTLIPHTQDAVPSYALNPLKPSPTHLCSCYPLRYTCYIGRPTNFLQIRDTFSSY